MNKAAIRLRLGWALGVAVLLFALVFFVESAHGDSLYSLSFSVVASGGGSGSSGAYTLNGTAGQPSAGVGANSGGYGLSSGFWNVADLLKVFLPAILR
ncbi:MAG: hypothetical protein HYR71_10345 [Chloroflexi bacterium]|nr:hypothetical protein [Chloroflexota bacterium]